MILKNLKNSKKNHRFLKTRPFFYHHAVLKGDFENKPLKKQIFSDTYVSFEIITIQYVFIIYFWV